jgi:integrating conjugative element protein (TIGR03757 family)
MQRLQHVLPLTLIVVATALSPVRAEAPLQPMRIDVFTTGQYPVQNVPEFLGEYPEKTLHVHQIDRIERLEAELSLNLPGNPEQARRQALKRMKQLSRERQSQLQQTAKALVLAMQLGVDRVPAIVFDQQHVIYGLTDLSMALQVLRGRQGGSH